MANEASKDKCPIHDVFCPVHKDVQVEIRDLKTTQSSRHCGAHEAQIAGLDADLSRVERDNAEQWVAINQLRRLVYMGAGGVIVASFVGAMLGNLLMGLLKR